MIGKFTIIQYIFALTSLGKYQLASSTSTHPEPRGVLVKSIPKRCIQRRTTYRTPTRVVGAADIVTTDVSNTTTAVTSQGTTGSIGIAAGRMETVSRVVVGGRGRVGEASSRAKGGAGRGRGQSSAVAVSGGAGSTACGGVKITLKCHICSSASEGSPQIGNKQLELVMELHGIQFPHCSWTAESIHRKFSNFANQQPSKGDPAIPPLVAMAKEIREVINVKAGVSDAGVTEFFDDKEPMDEVVWWRSRSWKMKKQ
jgi:hypothetical protein